MYVCGVYMYRVMYVLCGLYMCVVCMCVVCACVVWCVSVWYVCGMCVVCVYCVWCVCYLYSKISPAYWRAYLSIVLNSEGREKMFMM